MIAIREDIAMAFFKRELSPVKRFKNALRDKQVARQKLADRLSIAETVLGEKRVAAERLAVAGGTNAQLERAEANMRAVEDRAKALRAALAEFDRSEEHTSELQSRLHLVCRLLLEKKKKKNTTQTNG